MVSEEKSFESEDGRTTEAFGSGELIKGLIRKKFQMNPMKYVGGAAETRSWLATFKSAWTPSKIVKSKCYNHMHIFIS